MSGQPRYVPPCSASCCRRLLRRFVPRGGTTAGSRIMPCCSSTPLAAKTQANALTVQDLTANLAAPRPALQGADTLQHCLTPCLPSPSRRTGAGSPTEPGALLQMTGARWVGRPDSRSQGLSVGAFKGQRGGLPNGFRDPSAKQTCILPWCLGSALVARGQGSGRHPRRLDMGAEERQRPRA